MGCDIHLFVEKRTADGVWVDITKPEDDPGRSYLLFAYLAGVRNDEGVTPISGPRGIPTDVSTSVREYMADDCDLHSRSWLSVAEMLEWRWLGLGSWWRTQHLDQWHQIVIEDPSLTLDDVRIVFAFDN